MERAHPRLATASDLEASAAIPGGVEPSARLAEIETFEAARAATDRKLSSVETLIGNLARVDGPKAVVLMADGYGGDASSARVRSIVAAAGTAGVRFHVLDESGSDRDAAGGLARGTGGIISRKASGFAAVDRVNRQGDACVGAGAAVGGRRRGGPAAPAARDAAGRRTRRCRRCRRRHPWRLRR